MSVLIEITLIIILIVLNGYFSMSEIALLSVKKSRLKHLANRGDKRALQALFLTRQSSAMLSTIQIGITAIGILAGAFGGATVAEHLEKVLVKWTFIGAYSEPISVAVVVVVITYVSLIIGELVPKQIALANPEKRALRVAGPITEMMKITKPFVGFLSRGTEILLKLLKIKPVQEQVVTEEEIRLLIAEGAESGIFEKSEQKMVESIFHLGNRPIRDFMTPRSAVVWLDINDSFNTLKNKIIGSDRSVFPVADGTLDNSIGVVEIKDITTHLFAKGDERIDLPKLIQPVKYIDAAVPALVAIERLRRSATNIALIADSVQGKIVGLITFHDILEAIVGEFKQP